MYCVDYFISVHVVYFSIKVFVCNYSSVYVDVRDYCGIPLHYSSGIQVRSLSLLFLQVRSFSIFTIASHEGLLLF